MTSLIFVALPQADSLLEQTLQPKEFERLRSYLHAKTGIALSDSKKQMVQARLQKKLRQLGCSTFGEYLDRAMQDPTEEVELINAMTTNKTDFFRENHHFEYLSKREFPRLIEEARLSKRPKQLRVWHAGCSTGEEPYSMAITIAESPLLAANWDVKLLASDIDTKVIAHAEAAIYDEERLDPIPLARRKLHFLQGKGERAGQYCVKPELREMIKFKQINLLESGWPMRSDVKFDIIFCRNVVIYFDRPTQATLFKRFASKLQPGGLLIIGHSENLHEVSSEFDAAGTTIYRLPVKAVGAAA